MNKLTERLREELHPYEYEPDHAIVYVNVGLAREAFRRIEELERWTRRLDREKHDAERELTETREALREILWLCEKTDPGARPSPTGIADRAREALSAEEEK